jgi:phospholipid/cholesterol/gamma-HCH transport system permease protein
VKIIIHIGDMFASAGKSSLKTLQTTGGLFLLFGRILLALVPPDFDRQETWKNLYKVGVKSFPIVVLTAFFTGAIMVIQSGEYVKKTGATGLVGWASGLAVLAEIGPVLIGLMFSGRVGANNTAELGTMKITEQIDALRILSIDPIKYLAVPRFFTMIMMLFLLTCIGDLFAIVGGGITSQILLGIDFRIYWYGIIDSHLLDEFIMGLVKGVCFGGMISVVSCYFGFRVEGGAPGVGRAVNNSVVSSAIGIFVINYVITYIWLR